MKHGTWGYRFEGHHVSLNYAIVDGKIASSPSFFGSNPAQILDGRRNRQSSTRLRELALGAATDAMLNLPL